MTLNVTEVELNKNQNTNQYKTCTFFLTYKLNTEKNDIYVNLKKENHLFWKRS